MDDDTLVHPKVSIFIRVLKDVTCFFVNVLGGYLEIEMDENETLRGFLFPAPEIAKIRHPRKMKRCA